MSYKHHQHFPTLQRMWEKGTSFLGSQFGILGGAMSWISEHNLVSAISNAGGFGVLASGALSPEALQEEIQKTQEKTSYPFGVNLIVFHPQIQNMLHVCQKMKVSHVFLGGGLPSSESIGLLKDAGIRVVAFAPSLAIGKRLIKLGAEALVLEGTEAGGHVGPVSTSVLAQELLPELKKDVPIFMAGGIGTGSCIGAYLSLGASGCQLGTRFVCAEESIAHPLFKDAFIRANSRDAVLSVQIDPRFPVIPVRALSNAGMKKFLEAQQEAIAAADSGKMSIKEAQLQIELFWAGALRRAVIEGDIQHGSLMAGQSVGMVKAIQSTKDIIHQLVEEALEHLSPHS